MEADYSLSMNVQPVEVVYDEHSIAEVTSFFQLPHGVVDLKSALMETMNSMAEYSRAGLHYVIETHTVSDSSLCLPACPAYLTL